MIFKLSIINLLIYIIIICVKYQNYYNLGKNLLYIYLPSELCELLNSEQKHTKNYVIVKLLFIMK